MQEKLGFLGGGQMATALAAGAIKSGLIKPEEIVFLEPNQTQKERLAQKFPKAILLTDSKELFKQCRRILLAVKPQVLREIAQSLQPETKESHCLISIAAGIPLESLATWFKTDSIVRVMPNTPAQVQAGASGISYGRTVNGNDRAWVQSLFSSIGKSVEVPDHLMHAVTGLSGSGPAYVLMMIEAMADGGVAAGLSREVALELATQTVYGTALMVAETKLHPAVLKDQVASPAGTTIAGIAKLEEQAFRSAIIQAVLAATTRSKELA